MTYIKRLFTLKTAPQNHLPRVIAAGVCALIVNLTGLILQNPAINGISTLGLFTFLNYQSFEGHRILKRLIFVGTTLIMAYGLGLLIGRMPLASPVIIGLVAFFARLVYRIYHIDKPGDIFVILVLAAGATKTIPLQMIPVELAYISFGVIVSLIVAVVMVHIQKAPKQSFTVTLHFKKSIRLEPRMVVDSFFYAAVLFFAAYVNIALGLSRYSWIIVSCSAILQGNTLKIILDRSFQRIAGTIMGLLTAALLIQIPFSQVLTVVMIVVLYVIVEYFIPRNYSLGIFFVTNMVLLQLSIQNPSIGIEYIGDRFIGITVGTIIGTVAAYIQYHLYRFYSQSIIQDRTYDFKEKMDEGSKAHQSHSGHRDQQIKKI